MRILSIDGGGYLGLATVALLDSVEERFGTSCSNRFDLFCGTSTGAIIALALANGMASRDVVDLYIEIGPKVFPPPNFLARRFPNLRGILGARHSNAGLRDALANAFGKTTLGDLRARGKKVLVTAFCLSSGHPTVFKTDHADGLTAHDGYLLSDIALASSAAPTYLPPVSLKDPKANIFHRYCDGGIVANSPALIGYAEAIWHLKQPPQNISILSISTPRADLAERDSAMTKAQRLSSRGYVRWGFGRRIITLTIDGTTTMMEGALNRIANASGSRHVRIDFQQPAGVGLDIVTPEATETLKQLGIERARNTNTLQDLIPFFSNTNT
jgi:patatin-like phospholipase/acyl hydrolase